MNNIHAVIANELNVGANQVAAAVNLLDEGSTVPFISRYRKEVTGGLDDTQLRTLEDRLRYLRELQDRKQTILASIEEQGKLTPALTSAINNAETKNTLEDLYLPYKKKRRTKGQIAIEAGLEPLAEALFADPTQVPDNLAAAYVDADKGIADIKAALDGAKYILMERFAEDATLLAKLRQFLRDEGCVISQLVDGKEQDGEKFRDYFEYSEIFAKVPSHRALAVFRGRNEGVLSVKVDLDHGEEKPLVHPCELMVAKHVGIKDEGRSADTWLREVVRWTWRVKLHSHLETDLLGDLRDRAEDAAIHVFADNLKDLLLAAPAGPKTTIGLDPGLRTGTKVAVVDNTGKLLDYATIYPHQPQNKIAEAAAKVIQLAEKYNAELVAIGNGTASRETDRFVGDIIKQFPKLGLKKIVVSEAGASVYSASEFAAKEFPDLDVTIRGAVSIARRLQDPLAELVKIEPKAIGVGQYQHDVSQTQLARGLDAVVEDCVNAVGVDVNMASVALLSRVSGLNARLAQNIVDFRDQHGVFKARNELKKVARFGDKTFEQAAGFLRIMDGTNTLDRSAVHPESYSVVQLIADKNGREIRSLMGDPGFLKSLKAADYTSEQFGIPTVTDIISELDKPGRDPRPEFKTADFKDGVEKISDLKPGMILEGTVTNVTAFGAFVDVGVHQDGLVHISALSHEFVKDPRDVVKAGDIVKVKVMEVDVQRKRIGMSMRLDDEPGQEASRGAGGNKNERRGSNKPKPGGYGSKQTSQSNNAFAAAFADAKQKKR
ncbi:Protein YhgF [BD1-7 clade bacterium]|uniref:Protein YhgF n=1 Tax=BD1-7 clade bacterium TaxID=2029982 RepID=A0A5S9QD06_9GAMM|nr:Protein YhgF [BD1-7 clade bacterium]